MLAPDRAVEIRRASPQDQRAGWSVVFRTWLSAYGDLFGQHRIIDAFTGKSACTCPWFEQRSREFGWWVAAQGDKVIASAGVHLRRDGDAELSHLYVLHEHQGAGTGSALLGACSRALRESGCLALRLWVLEQTPAAGFYRRRHAQEIGRDTITVGDQREPVLAMRIRLWAKRSPHRSWTPSRMAALAR